MPAYSIHVIVLKWISVGVLPGLIRSLYLEVLGLIRLDNRYRQGSITVPKWLWIENLRLLRWIFWIFKLELSHLRWLEPSLLGWLELSRPCRWLESGYLRLINWRFARLTDGLPGKRIEIFYFRFFELRSLINFSLWLLISFRKSFRLLQGCFFKRLRN